MKYVDPTSHKANKEKTSSPLVVSTLAGKTVGMLSNDWPSYEQMIVRFRERLVERHKVSRILCYRIPRISPAPDELLEKVAGECDAVVVGLGN